ncbi:hypothetical protein BDZ85DRAFT_270535 [Elsinoe ampelina]|uniref:Uncharacterized protein n=1 Tax=Elsinoe ampelina TaxID=302913 RepID=A0A6A6FY45_9PEZI|nr:hypothetical protein BDZ85DRAFT_270535 [Elsinoe ampelina]
MAGFVALRRQGWRRYTLSCTEFSSHIVGMTAEWKGRRVRRLPHTMEKVSVLCIVSQFGAVPSVPPPREWAGTWEGRGEDRQKDVR